MTMRQIGLPTGEKIPVLGLGTWNMGDRRDRRKSEVDALRLGLDLGMTLIDTAEMYAEGGAEEVVGEAIQGRRDQVYLVSKVYPHNASRQGAVAACERSLKRLKVDRLDLYLLHWRGNHPLTETLEAFQSLAKAGKIRHYGVSNFDTDDMEELWRTGGGPGSVTNQVLYNASRRGIEFSLIPWCRKHKVPVMAYSPLDQGGRLLRNSTLVKVATRHSATVAQVALAWVLHRPGVFAIPKASDPDHVRQNCAALDLKLAPDDLADIDKAFPPPQAKRPLEIL
jgi:diketogulonate reductase-like aldo/keto reductase